MTRAQAAVPRPRGVTSVMIGLFPFAFVAIALFAVFAAMLLAMLRSRPNM